MRTYIYRLLIGGIALSGSLAAVMPVPLPLGGSPVPRKVRRAISESLTQFDKTTLFAQLFFLVIALVVLSGFCYGLWRLYVRYRARTFLRQLYHIRCESMRGTIARNSITQLRHMLKQYFFRFKLGRLLIGDLTDMVARLEKTSYSDVQKHDIVSYIREVISLL